MKTIQVISPKNDSLSQQLLAFYLLFKNINSGESVIFDLSKLSWCCPFLILPIASHINELKGKFILPQNPDVTSYLKTIHFPEGISSVGGLQPLLSYIPIGILERENANEREKLESCFAKMIYKVMKPTTPAQNAVYYPLTELTTNIFEHSKKDIGYIFAQNYPKKEFLDMCIVDCGRGLVKSYKEERGLNFTDAEAIKQVLMGRSAKPELERGYGIRTSKRVVCEGLGGGFVLISGKTALYSFRNKEKIISMPNFYWRGVIVVYRIPRPQKRIDITSYIE